LSGRRERALEIARAAGADVLLAARPATVTWLSGYAVELEGGPGPFALSPLLVLREGAPPLAVASEDEAPVFVALGCEVATYPGSTLEPPDAVGGARRALADAVDGARAATETGWLPAALADGLTLDDVAAELAAARAVKDPDELAALRAAVAVCDAGQRAAREHARPGVSELELWARVRAAIESAAGGRTSVVADLVSGARTADVGGAPGERVLAEGDLVLCDLVPRVAGYWGDSCATFAIGEPDAAARTQHTAARDALARGLDALRPGLRAGDLDALVRAGLDYPHHTGHGLGADWHEEPRIGPGGSTVLEAGMVVALEPGVYADGRGVRCEQVAVVTGGGCEILSGHGLEL
jgi:Xaa-Pro aminopeptidase